MNYQQASIAANSHPDAEDRADQVVGHGHLDHAALAERLGDEGPVAAQAARGTTARTG